MTCAAGAGRRIRSPWTLDHAPLRVHAGDVADTFHHEPPYTIGVICGSIAVSSINRRLANAMINLAPADLQCSYIEIDTLDL